MLKARDRIAPILKELYRLYPDPTCELYYKTPYQLLVSVVLSAQATDVSVNKAMREIYDNGFTPSQMAAMGEKGFLEKIRSIGLAPTKAKNVMRLTQILLESHQGEIPNTREALEALPGVGRKTASVVLGEIFRQPTIAVDTHVFRVSKRLELHRATTPEKCEMKLLELIPSKHLPAAHHLFILHGRRVCHARGAKCDLCPLAKRLCPSAGKV